MERLQNPFSLYDFLGYLIPGSFGLYCFLILTIPEDIKVGNVLSYHDLDGYDDALLLIILCYIIGHLISYLSSISIENFSVWSLGYPSKYLLHVPSKGYWDSAFYDDVGSNEYMIRITSRAIIYIFLLPISLLDDVIGKCLYARLFYSRKLDTYTKDIITERVIKGIDGIPGLDILKSDIRENDFFRIIYHYCLENVSSHQNKFQNYVSLYGLMRAISLIFLTLFWVTIFIETPYQNWLIVSVTGILSYISYMAYNKFSRRFTLEVLMSFVTIKSKQDNNFTYTSDLSNYTGSSGST
ncbi:MAG: hypothetical protein WD016_11125 [Balneolaceae bacterium]